MSDGTAYLEPQPAPPNAPEAHTSAPYGYLSAADAIERLSARYNLSAPNIAEGHVLAASMALDEEGPFYGVKVNPEQERDWPRTFKYGWPNIVMVPDAMLLTENDPGAFYLNYEGVIPDQVLDWTSLFAYRLTTLPFDKEIASENVTGASVRYLQWTGKPGDAPSQLDILLSTLLAPFQMTQLRQQPWPYYSDR